jgi:hypothetical protein
VTGLGLATRRTEGDAPGEKSLMVFPRPVRSNLVAEMAISQIEPLPHRQIKPD